LASEITITHIVNIQKFMPLTLISLVPENTDERSSLHRNLRQYYCTIVQGNQGKC